MEADCTLRHTDIQFTLLSYAALYCRIYYAQPSSTAIKDVYGTFLFLLETDRVPPHLLPLERARVPPPHSKRDGDATFTLLSKMGMPPAP